MKVFFISICTVFLLFFSLFGLLISNIGYKASVYFVSQFFVKNGIDKFQPIFYRGEGLYPEDRYRQYGLFLASEGNNIWMLTISGINHYIPINVDSDEVFYLGLDSCKEEQGIKQIIYEDGSIILKETRFDNIDSWLKNNSIAGLKIFSVTYLAEDKNQIVKRFRYIHALNGLTAEGDLDAVCLK